MTNEVRAFELDFQLQSDDEKEDLERPAAALADSVSALPGVNGAAAEVSGRARLIDPVSIGAILLTVRFAVKGAADTVAALDDLVNQIKALARDLGLPHLWVWLRREKIDVRDLTAAKLQELAADATPTDT